MKASFFIAGLSLASVSAFAQAQGIFTYQNDFSDEIATGKVVTRFYQSKSMVRIESTNTTTKSSLGAPTSKDQDVIVMDIDKQTETHFVAKMKMASVGPFTSVSGEAIMKQMGTDVSIQNIGPEKIGKYNCTHFVITTTNPKYKSLNNAARKDVWITKDLGNGNVYFVGPYLYYPKGSLVAKKIVDAGGEGIVVRWQVIDPLNKKPNTCDLVNYEPGAVPASQFTPPSGYQVMRH